MRSYLVITILIMFWLPLQAQSPLEVKTDFKVDNASVSKALKQLGTQSGVSIAFSSRFFPRSKKVTLNVSNKKVDEILPELLKGVNVGYKVIQNQVILFKKPPPKKYTLSGYVKDAETGEKLVNANIYFPETGKGTISNEYGFYSITLPKTTVSPEFSFIGYQHLTQSLNLDTHIRLDVSLQPSITLEEVTVMANTAESKGLNPISSEQFTKNRMDNAVGLGGETDLIGIAQLTSGIQSGADGIGGMYVRGGNLGQNLLLMDGVPVYNPYHMMGLFSVYNSNVVKSARLLKGGFPARYGGRVSSVFDVRTKEGNTEQISGEVSVGLATSKASLEGPLFNKKSSFLITARRSNFNLFLRPISQEMAGDGQEGDFDYRFFDLNAKWNYKLTERDHLYLSIYYGNDKFTAYSLEGDDFFEEFYEAEINWGNTIASLRWNHLFGNRLFSNTTFTYSDYSFFNNELNVFSEFDTYSGDLIDELFFFYGYGSNIRDFALKTDFDFSPTPNHYMRFGAGVAHHQFVPVASYFDTDSEFAGELDSLGLEALAALISSPELGATELHAYVEDEFKITPKWMLNAGLRTTAFIADGKTWVNTEPRLNTTYFIREQFSANASFSYVTQYMHLLSAANLGLPSDVWVPSSENIAPQKSWQAVGGINAKFRKGVEIDVEGYYKKMYNLIAFREDTSIFFEDNFNWEEEVITGAGNGFGVEFSLKKEAGKTGGWVNYTLSWGEREFEDLNLGKKYPFTFDRRHAFKAAVFHRFSDKFSINADWVYNSGSPELVVYEAQSIGDLTAVDLSEDGKKNAYRMPAYHRLNIAANFRFKRPKTTHKLSLGVYNVYNRENPAFYRINFANPFEQESESFIEPVSILPVLPSLSYTFKF